jgi:lipid-A-disaccharide synthase
MGRRILIVAGEASGDLHGGALVEALRARAPDLALEGIGGDCMAAAGVRLHVHARDLGVVGLVEALARLPAIRAAFARMRALLEADPPDLAVLIDYPEFNLRLARVAARAGVPVCYYVGPQVWAWRRGRLALIRRLVRKMVVIFPFEEAVYRAAGVDVAFVGHPLLDRLAPRERAEARRGLGLADASPVLGLLPGSRVGEVERHLPVMLAAAAALRREHPKLGVAFGRAPGLPAPFVARCLAAGGAPVRVAEGGASDVLSAADLAFVASGTATVEAALHGTPMVIIYRVALLTWLVGRLLIRVPWIGMANLIAGRLVVPELIQFAATPERLAGTARRLLADPAALERMRQELAAVRLRLGPPGASARAAEAILALLEEAAPGAP